VVDLLHRPGLERTEQAQLIVLMRAWVADGRYFLLVPLWGVLDYGPGVAEDWRR
jgi:hypothetical protein